MSLQLCIFVYSRFKSDVYLLVQFVNHLILNSILFTVNIISLTWKHLYFNRNVTKYVNFDLFNWSNLNSHCRCDDFNYLCVYLWLWLISGVYCFNILYSTDNRISVQMKTFFLHSFASSSSSDASPNKTHSKQIFKISTKKSFNNQAMVLIELKFKIQLVQIIQWAVCKFIHGVEMNFVHKVWNSALCSNHGTIFWPIRIWIKFMHWLEMHIAHRRLHMHRVQLYNTHIYINKIETERKRILKWNSTNRFTVAASKITGFLMLSAVKRSNLLHRIHSILKFSCCCFYFHSLNAISIC